MQRRPGGSRRRGAHRNAAIAEARRDDPGCVASSTCQGASSTSLDATEVVEDISDECVNWQCDLIGMTVINYAERGFEACASTADGACALLAAQVAIMDTTARAAALQCVGLSEPCTGIAPLLEYEATTLADALNSPGGVPSCDDSAICRTLETTVQTSLG
jgi:hypothetical protein